MLQTLKENHQLVAQKLQSQLTTSGRERLRLRAEKDNEQRQFQREKVRMQMMLDDRKDAKKMPTSLLRILCLGATCIMLVAVFMRDVSGQPF